MEMAWTCRCCGRQFDTLPTGWSWAKPDLWAETPEALRQPASRLDSDLCRMEFGDRTHHFIRGTLEIPIIGTDDVLSWGVWSSLSERSFERALELWDAEDVSGEERRFGWLANRLPPYADARSVALEVWLRSDGLRPSFRAVSPEDHPIVVDQGQGVTLERVQDYVTALMPRN
jgi:hypothetical protein